MKCLTESPLFASMTIKNGAFQTIFFFSNSCADAPLIQRSDVTWLLCCFEINSLCYNFDLKAHFARGFNKEPLQHL